MEDWGAVRAREQDARNLLARIHRDGGHHTEAVGFKQSCLDAEQEWLALRQRVEELERDICHSDAHLMERTGNMIGWKLRAAEAEAEVERLLDLILWCESDDSEEGHAWDALMDETRKIRAALRGGEE